MLFNKSKLSRLEIFGYAGAIFATILFIALYLSDAFFPALMSFYLPWLVLVLVGNSHRKNKNKMNNNS